MSSFFMRLILFLVFIVCLALSPARANEALDRQIDLEKKIAYQQGQFGALYAECGSPEDKVVIGGSLELWKDETFRGYKGSPMERHALEVAFDNASHDVRNDSERCRDWVRQAAVTWHSIILLVGPEPSM